MGKRKGNSYLRISSIRTLYGYATFFNGAYPARSCVEVARLPKDVMLEVEAIAVK